MEAAAKCNNFGMGLLSGGGHRLPAVPKQQQDTLCLAQAHSTLKCVGADNSLLL